MKKKTVQKFQHRKPDNSLKNPWLFAGVLLPITFIVFSPALFNEFVNWDDYNYIRDNPLLQDFSLNTIRHLFNFGTFVMGNYHPFTMLSYLAEYHFAGSSPFLYHFDNIILHLFNVALISVLIWKLTGKYYATLIAAALFALHPMRVESVVWAAERKDVLYAFFYLVSIIAYTYYIRSSEKRYVYYTVSLLVFLFSLLSKGQAVVLPLTFFLVDYWYGKKIDFKSVASKIPFLALSVFFGILAINAQSSSLTSQRLISYTFGERIVFAAYNLVAYLYKLIYPYDLACYYGYPDESGMKLIYAGALLAVGIMAFVFLRFRKNKAVMFGTLFFLATIFIVIQLLPVGNAIIADRYTYIPYIGLFFIIALLLDPLLSTGSLKRRRIAGALIGLQLLVFAVASFSQAKTWKNNETLWLRAIDNEPEQGMPYNNLGIYLMEQKKYDTAILLLNRS
ncbi:MAG: tetratricopeptide repeat protein, partial [bacterium]